VAKFGLSARSYHRTLRVARTIADFDACEQIEIEHVAEAIQLKRALDNFGVEESYLTSSSM
jgi:magnesium chelatase family protein